jgi:hypothetical protein
MRSDCFTGGLVGPLIIHGPSNANYDIDLGPVFLTDWYHSPYFDIVEEIMEPNGNPRPSSGESHPSNSPTAYTNAVRQQPHQRKDGF